MKVNIQQSISRERIIRQKTFWEIVSNLINVVFWAIYPICLIMILFNKTYHNNFPYLFYLIMWAPAIWYLYGFKYINKLTYLGEYGQESKNKLINHYISKFDVETIHNDKNLIILKKETGSITWGKEITLIISDDKVWCNITTLGRYDIKSPFHSYFNYKNLKS